jgi:hypothetical protein
MAFLEIFMQALKSNGIADVMPSDLIAKWDEFVGQCEEGYQYSLYDYDNQLTIRDDIAVVIQNEILKDYKEYRDFVKQIDVIDQRLKSVSSEYYFTTEEEWWKRRILKYAGVQYVENVKTEWGIDVTVVLM